MNIFARTSAFRIPARRALPLLPLLAALMLSPPATLADVDAERRQFIDRMVSEHGFDADKLTALLDQAEVRESILNAISRPAERKPWYEYRPIFLQDSRIEGGVAFWERHWDALTRAEAQYGVPAEIIVAIIGVETRYGRHAGRYRVIDALNTLGFHYPPRAKFFRSELEQFLLMTREEGLDPLSVKGSYAGAMGQPQFISSSFRHYAVDFDDDGKRDIWGNPTDAIGSVGNYLGTHGWRRGDDITFLTGAGRVDHEPFLGNRLKPDTTLASFREHGVPVPEQYGDDELGTLIALETRNGHEYWIGLQNFYAITRYNHSALYAMAVYQLSQEILDAYRGEGSARAVGADEDDGDT